MPLKEGFIDGYILDRNDAFILFVLEDPVYQEQRIAMRQVVQDLLNVKHPLILLYSGDRTMHLRMVLSRMRRARFVVFRLPVADS